MAVLLKYRLWCETESEWVYWWKGEGDTAPTTCPNNTAHTIVGDAVQVDKAGQEAAIGEYGEMMVSQRPLAGSLSFYEDNRHMPSLTDPCSWYHGSVEVANQALTDDGGDHKTWSSPDSDLIDLFHHRVMDEEQLPDVSNYKINVEVDSGGGWVEFTEKDDIWNSTTEQLDYSLIGADEYFVLYDEGKVVFGVTQEGNSVRASYYKANGFLYILAPADGKILEIKDAEVQGSVDLVYTCAMAFQLWGFDPTKGFNPVEPKVPWDVPMVVGTQWGFISEGKGNYAPAEAIGGNYKYGQVPRGMVNKAVIMPFPYNTSKILKSSLGMEMRVFFMEGSGPWLGEFGNATFYCLEYVDPDWPA